MMRFGLLRPLLLPPPPAPVGGRAGPPPLPAEVSASHREGPSTGPTAWAAPPSGGGARAGGPGALGQPGQAHPSPRASCRTLTSCTRRNALRPGCPTRSGACGPSASGCTCGRPRHGCGRPGDCPDTSRGHASRGCHRQAGDAEASAPVGVGSARSTPHRGRVMCAPVIREHRTAPGTLSPGPGTLARVGWGRRVLPRGPGKDRAADRRLRRWEQRARRLPWAARLSVGRHQGAGCPDWASCCVLSAPRVSVWRVRARAFGGRAGARGTAECHRRGKFTERGSVVTGQPGSCC